MRAIIILFITLMFCVKAEASNRIFVPDYENMTFNVISPEGEIILRSEAQFPLETSSLNLPYNQYHIYRFFNDSGDFMEWRINNEQEPATFYLQGSVTKHFTSFPEVINGIVEISNPDTGDVFYTTRTDSAGAFEIVSTQIPNVDKDDNFILIEVKGGKALYVDRDASNRMAAIVRSDSISRGSITISMMTTAAFLAVDGQKTRISPEDYKRIYQSNLNRVTRTFYENVSEWDYETSYLSPEKEVKLEDAFGVDREEFFTRKITGTQYKLFDLMHIDSDSQYDGLSKYFGLIGWGPISPEHLTSKALDLKSFHRGSFTVKTFIINEDFTKTLTSEYVINPVSNEKGVFFSFPTIIYGNNESVTLTPHASDGFTFLEWLKGCNSAALEQCKVSENAHEVIALFDPINNVGTKNNVFFDDTNFALAGNEIKGLRESSFGPRDINFLSSLSSGDILLDKRGRRFIVESVSNPGENFPPEDYVIDITPISSDGPVEYNLSTSIDYWELLMGRENPYEPGSILPISWDDSSQTGTAIFTSNNKYDKAVMGEFTVVPSDSPATIQTYSLSEPGKTCYQKTSKSPELLKGVFSASFQAKLCMFDGSSFSVGKINIKRIGTITEYSTPASFKGTSELQFEGSAGFQILKNPLLNPTVKVIGSANIDKFSVTYNVSEEITFHNESVTGFSYISSNGEFLKKSNYKSSVSGAMSSGSVKVGVYIENPPGIVDFSVGISTKGELQALENKLDQNGICPFSEVPGLNVKVSATSEIDFWSISREDEIGVLLKRDIFFDDYVSHQSNQDDCLNPNLEILESPHTMVIDGGYFVEDRKYFTISNNTPLDANLSINLSSKMFEPIERINLPPYSSKTVQITPIQNKIMILGAGTRKVLATFTASFGNEKGIHHKSFSKKIPFEYFVESDHENYVIFPIEKIEVDEYQWGISQIKGASFGVDAIYDENNLHTSTNNADFKASIRKAIANRLLYALKTSQEKYPPSYSKWVDNVTPSDFYINDDLISIKSIQNQKRFSDMGHGFIYRPFVQEWSRIGSDYLLTGQLADILSRDGLFQTTIVEYGHENNKISNIYPARNGGPDWYRPGELEGQIYYTSKHIQKAYSYIRGSGRLKVNFIDKYTSVFGSGSCEVYDKEAEEYVTRDFYINSIMPAKDGEMVNASHFNGITNVSLKSKVWCIYGDECQASSIFNDYQHVASKEGESFALSTNFCNGTGRVGRFSL